MKRVHTCRHHETNLEVNNILRVHKKKQSHWPIEDRPVPYGIPSSSFRNEPILGWSMSYLQARRDYFQSVRSTCAHRPQQTVPPSSQILPITVTGLRAPEPLLSSRPIRIKVSLSYNATGGCGQAPSSCNAIFNPHASGVSCRRFLLSAQMVLDFLPLPVARSFAGVRSVCGCRRGRTSRKEDRQSPSPRQRFERRSTKLKS